MSTGATKLNFLIVWWWRWWWAWWWYCILGADERF